MPGMVPRCQIWYLGTLTAQCVPEQGDWYARAMYQEGSADYNYEVAHYGHPSQVGFKDMDNRWKAEH